MVAGTSTRTEPKEQRSRNDRKGLRNADRAADPNESEENHVFAKRPAEERQSGIDVDESASATS